MNNFFETREIHIFDVETFINDVYNKFCGTPNEESREDLQRLFYRVLDMPRGGDASLYPNAHGRRPAMLEVWHKAGDFWRANGYRKPARLLCDQYGIAIDEETAQRIAAAKATTNGTTTATDESKETPAEAPTAAQADASGLSPHPTADTPTEATETPTTPPCGFTVCDGSAVAPSPSAEAQEEATTTDDDPNTTADDYDPGVIVPEAAYPARATRRRRRTGRYRPSAPLPSLFDDCEITDSTDAPTETPADDEMVTTRHRFSATLKDIAKSDTARELAKGIGIIAAIAIIYESGLIIPFALFGGLVGGFIK